jgi:hypothetical protein
MIEHKIPKIQIKQVMIEKLFPTKIGNIQTREVVFSWVEEDKARYVKAQCKNEKCSVLNKFEEGDIVDVTLVVSCMKKYGLNDEVFFYQNINLNYIEKAKI